MAPGWTERDACVAGAGRRETFAALDDCRRAARDALNVLPTQADLAYGRFDRWRDRATVDPEQARALTQLLEPRARDPDQVATRAA